MDRTLGEQLVDVAPELEQILTHRRATGQSDALLEDEQIRRETVWMTLRDGVRLATDLYLPPELPAAAVAMRTPYGRAADRNLAALMDFARRGYIGITQDCRGTGDSEPEVWHFGLYEVEDGVDFVEWVIGQPWYNGELYSFGGSYVGATQWGMSTHPVMTAIAPEVTGLRVTRNTVRRYMFVNVYPRVVGKGADRLSVPVTEIERVLEKETLAGGYFNASLRTSLPEAVLDQYPDLRNSPPDATKRALWKILCELPAAQRVPLLKLLLGVDEFSYEASWRLPYVLDDCMPYGLNTIPAVDEVALCTSVRSPALMCTGWYDWNLNDALASWTALRRYGRSFVAEWSRLIITPAAHQAPGYLEGQAEHPELQHDHRSNIELLTRWYEIAQECAFETWPRVIYYLMGANEWRVAKDWPVPEAELIAFYLGHEGTLKVHPEYQGAAPAEFLYDPTQPTPTVGGSILSFLYPVGSVDVSEVQKRSDVLCYTTPPLKKDVDVVGPIRLVLYASSSAGDTDFVGRLSDVFPDDRAIPLQNGILRTRYRHPEGPPELMEPRKVYRLEIDLWATANRFKAGHRLRLDISSSDFPRYDRNNNRAGEPGDPIPARQRIYHDASHPSHLLLSVLS